MKDEALALVADIANPAHKLNLLREYLQAFVLRSLHESEAFLSVAFVGGTALRFLENIPRFSEDLDFSLVDAKGYSPEQWLSKIRRDLTKSGFDCKLTFNGKKTINTAWIRVSGLLEQVGLSGHTAQNLSIRLEIDTLPPAGADFVRTVIVRHLTFALCHHTLPSLMSGKLHALIARPYSKGRDWFDLLWYCAHRPPVKPHLLHLQNALDQTEGVNRYKASNWPQQLMEKVDQLNIKKLAQDVEPFLERPADRALLTKDNLRNVLGAMV